MPEIGRSFFQISYENPFFVVLAVLAVALLVVALFFVGAAVYVRLRSQRRRSRVGRREACWKPLLLKAMAGEHSPEAVREHVAPGERRDFLDLVYRFARRVQGRKRATLREIAHPLLHVLDADAEADRPERRARRLQIVGLLGLSDYLDDVVRALDDEAPLVAIVAARALARREHPQHVAKVLARLDRFAEWSGGMLSSLLANLGLAVAPDLRSYLADTGREPWARAAVADALRKLGDPEAAGVAFRLLQDMQERSVIAEPDVTLVTASLRLLKAVGRREHFGIVAALAAHDRYAVRIHAVGALGPVGGDAATDRLLDAVNDPSPWVAMQAVEGLKRLGRRDALRDLAAAEGERAALAQQALVEKRVTAR
jgi:HEAT repeat protein